MILQEKLARETGREIYLYKQGVFWVAYEQSALLLGLEKELKPSFRFIKAVDSEVLSVGFPESTRSFFCDIFGSFTETAKNTGYFKLNGQYDAIDLDARRKHILNENAEKCHLQNKKRSDTLTEMIMAFRLADKTPIEAMLFVKELQEKIRLGG
jgi:hypothetical protein